MNELCSIDETHHGDDWQYRVCGFDKSAAAYQESLFAVGNGYIGVRGYFDEGYGADLVGENLANTAAESFLNGVYESLPIDYDEPAYGLAENCHRLINVPRVEFLISINGQVFDISHGHITGLSRELDYRSGVYRRQLIWTAPDKKQIKLNFERVALIDNTHVLLSRVELTALNFTGAVKVRASLNAGGGKLLESDDPREGGAIPAGNWQCLLAEQEQAQSYFLHQARNSQVQVASCLQTSARGDVAMLAEQASLIHEHSLHLVENQAQEVLAIVCYHDSRGDEHGARLTSCNRKLCEWYSQVSYAEIMRTQRSHLANFWRSADIQIESDDGAQTAARFALFHLLQSTGCDGQSSIAAKGVTGAGYDGHYFWDSEVYVFPFWLFSDPLRAKALLQYRINTLPAARENARKLGHKQGALFAWRTIGGEECSSYFPAGSAQYHINADIAYATRSYVRISGDVEFLQQGLAELVIDTARIWMSLGHFSTELGGEFSIHEVTGPDEYTAMVDNNFYTNRMAQAHLLWAAEVVSLISTEYKNQLFNKLDIDDSEVNQWHQAARSMRLPFNQQRGIYEQHDGFLNKPKWDFVNTREEQYPLLLHFHPLHIYRHQVLKQADTILALILEGQDVGLQTKQNCFDYYEPLTTHDSTLSACMHGVLASEIGRHGRAYEYISETLNLDLENKHNNTHYGVHTAAMGGVWMGVVQGFAGLRYTDGKLSFNPNLPEKWRRLHFRLRYKGSLLEVSISSLRTDYTLLEGDAELEIEHHQQLVKVSLKQTLSLAQQQV